MSDYISLTCEVPAEVASLLMGVAGDDDLDYDDPITRIEWTRPANLTGVTFHDGDPDQPLVVHHVTLTPNADPVTWTMTLGYARATEAHVEAVERAQAVSA